MTKTLIEELGVSKAELYQAYQEFKKDKPFPDSMKGSSVVASSLFGIPLDNRTALFFLLYGLQSIEAEIEILGDGNG